MKVKEGNAVFTLELPQELLADMDRMAKAEMLSRSAWLRRLIAAAVKQTGRTHPASDFGLAEKQ